MIKFETYIWWGRWNPTDMMGSRKSDTLRDLLPYVQIKKKHGKHPWGCNIFPWVFFTFWNCTNGTKLHEASHVIHLLTTCVLFAIQRSKSVPSENFLKIIWIQALKIVGMKISDDSLVGIYLLKVNNRNNRTSC